MVFSEIVKTTNADIFKLATRDMDECFSAAEIATKIQFYIDRNGATDAVTVAESQSFYGTNPKYSHKQYSRKKPGSSTQQTNIGPNHTKGKTTNGFNNASKRRNESNKRGPRSSGWIEPCKFQNQPQGCMKQNCKFYHYKKTNGAYHMAHTNQDGTKKKVMVCEGTFVVPRIVVFCQLYFHFLGWHFGLLVALVVPLVVGT